MFWVRQQIRETHSPALVLIQTLQSCGYHGYLEGNKQRQHGDQQQITALKIVSAILETSMIRSSDPSS